MMKLPEKVPEKGFYYHYKHDPNGSVENYAYEFLGVGFHTESNEHFINYRPLYESASVYRASKTLGVPCIDNRPLEMWMGDVTIGGVPRKRFAKITDPKIIMELETIRAIMYP
jgi:hypothetical protein